MKINPGDASPMNANALLTAVTTALGTSATGTITLATIPTAVTTTVPAGGLAGWLGFTTTTTTTVVAAPVTVSVEAVVAVGALLVCGGYLAAKHLRGAAGTDIATRDPF
ncbi:MULTISPECIES: hypothetical protein [unclassified Thiocapsa]|uniref:hypothetical protein n=1 Tax=unclassified Thiocapsa TaxID=2641286 RepID=UPI0035B01BB6